MSKPTRPEFGYLTGEQAKERIFSQGLHISEWAIRNGYTPREVSLVLNGQSKGRHGKGFEIAVALGMRPAPEALERNAA